MATSPRFMELLKEIESLHNRKNAGYAGIDSTDPFRNFRFSEMFGVNSFIGVLVRISDKFIRISNLVKNPKSEQVGESIKDTLMDLSIYCLIAICLYEEETKKK